MVTHDVNGLMKLMGGAKPFVNRLQDVFDKGHYDMANEPDIAYPYLFNYVKGEEKRTQRMVSDLLDEYYMNSPDGLPGNDDTGTMSAWAVFSMMGIYPISPANPIYALTTPRFNKIIIHLDSEYYQQEKITIISNFSEQHQHIENVKVNGKPFKGYFIDHDELVNGKTLEFKLKQ